MKEKNQSAGERSKFTSQKATREWKSVSRYILTFDEQLSHGGCRKTSDQRGGHVFP